MHEIAHVFDSQTSVIKGKHFIRSFITKSSEGFMVETHIMKKRLFGEKVLASQKQGFESSVKSEVIAEYMDMSVHVLWFEEVVNKRRRIA